MQTYYITDYTCNMIIKSGNQEFVDFSINFSINFCTYRYYLLDVQATGAHPNKIPQKNTGPKSACVEF